MIDNYFIEVIEKGAFCIDKELGKCLQVPFVSLMCCLKFYQKIFC
jgi:hypothetical protein